MDIRTQLHNDHTELRSLATDVMKSTGGKGPGSRDNQFSMFNKQVRRHFGAVEEVIFKPLVKIQAMSPAIHDIEAQHSSMRHELKALSHGDKTRTDWTQKFESLMAQLDSICHRHEAVAVRAQSEAEANGNGKPLGDRYTHAKLKRMPGYWDWNKIGLGAGAVAGLAAAAAAIAVGAKQRRDTTNGAIDHDDNFEHRLQTDETVRLIASDKVEGTKVVDIDGATLGQIENFMVDKYTGRVAYAVMSFGGMMGFGGSVFPIPWPLLEYDVEADAYVLDITKDELAAAPKYTKDASPAFDAVYRQRVILFYQNGRSEQPEGL